ncbi:MAG: aldose 1-epimerase family protein [Candidatus Latescibacterota bacterium]|nr:aldose 1-epimerase family protein [Candidatus Latescibacterota bacterium]
MSSFFEKSLTDTSSKINVSIYHLNSRDLPSLGDTPWSIVKYTLQGGLSEGVDVIEVDNGNLRFAILPTRGMGLWRGWYRETRLGWDSPVKDPVHPAFVDLNDRGGLGWLKGFNEWIVRCGLDNNGSPGKDIIIDNNGNEASVFLPLHGKIANTPARKVSIAVSNDGVLSVSGEVGETMMFGPALQLTTTISTALGSNELKIHDRVTNLGTTPAELELLYHCNYGTPILEEGARVIAPFKTVSPRDARAQEGIDSFDRFLKPTNGYVEQCYWYELAGRKSGETCVLLRNKKGTLGSSLRFNLNELPCFTVWKNTATHYNGYVTGLEPATNYPNLKQFERAQGRVIRLRGRKSYDIHMTVAAHDTRASLRAVEAEIATIQGRRKHVVNQVPKPHLSDLTG